MNSESYESHWRASANDAIPYPKDFTEWLTMIIELLNGGKKPTEVSLKFVFRGTKINFKYRDNGLGCSVHEANKRLLRWASVTSVDGKSMYGRGTKTFLAKSGDYATLKFAIRSRAKGSRDINMWSGPFKGTDTNCEVVDIEDFPVHGFEVEVDVDLQKVGPYNTPAKVFDALKEIICARKIQRVLSSVKFSVETYDNDTLVKKEDSKTNEWKSFQQTLATHPSCKLLLHKEVPFIKDKVKMIYDSYTTGLLEQVPGFPVYGKMGGGDSTRVHIFNEDTMHEAYSWWDLHEEGRHPSKWHKIEFVRFEPLDPANMEHVEALPQPATTKVQYRYETQAWQAFKALMTKLNEDHKKELTLPSKNDLRSPALPGSASNAASAASTPVLRSQIQPSTPVVPSNPGPTPVRPPIPAPPVPAPAPTIERLEATEFESAHLNDKFNELKRQRKSPERYTLPAWLKDKGKDCEDLLVYKEGDKFVGVYYRKRQRGSIETDIEKAYIALSRFVNDKKLQPSQVILHFCLHVESTESNWTTQFNEAKKKLNHAVYPYIHCIVLKQLINA